MANIARVRALWTGFQGAPGYSNFYFDASAGTGSLNDWANAVLTLFTAVQAYLPTDVKINIAQEALVIDAATGKAVGEELVGSVSQVGGTGAGDYSAPSGFCINWLTGVFVNGRQTHGRTFFVPGSTNAYDTDGSLSGGAVTAITNAAAAFVANQATPTFGIYSRPTVKRPVGAFTTVNLGTVPDKVVVLRSRRD